MNEVFSLAAIWAPILISLLSLITSTVTSVKNYKLEKRSNKLSDELRQLQLQKAKEEAVAKKSSKVEARHVPVGKRHRIRIANVGGTVVTNVTTTYNGSHSVEMQHDKEPFERLEPGEHFDQNLFVAYGSPSKFKIITHWRDTDGLERSRENIITL